MTRNRILVAAAALAALPASTFADGGSEPAGSAWDVLSKRFDLDGDGRITWDEYQKVASGFAALDKNRDGVITKDEVPAGGGSAVDALALGAFAGPLGGPLGGAGTGGFAPLVMPVWEGLGGLCVDDAGACVGGLCHGSCKDGACGVDAARAPWVAVGMLGAAADADHDGAITTAEWEVLLGSLHADGAGVVSTDALQKVLPELPPAAAGAILSMLLDADRDGKVSLDDLRAVFAAVDVNHDGRIDSKDRPAKPAAK